VAALCSAYPKEVTDRFLSDGPDAMPVPNALGTLVLHPGLAGPFLVFNNVLSQKAALSPRLRELAILRVAWRTRARYEWLQHARLAPRAGITAEEIAAVPEGATAPGWTSLEADVLAATDQLLDHYRVDDDTWARLAEQLDERQLIEVVFVVGAYTCLAMAFKSFGLELDPELQPIAITFPDFEE
jgi:4-carboxymuconolactone decarboxylase